MWAAAIYFLIPLYWLFVSATKDNADLFTTFGLWFGDRFALFDNITEVLTYQDGVYLRWIGNTILYSVAGAVGATLLATLAGYALAKYAFPGRRAVLSIVIGAVMIPLTALSIPTYLLFSSVGLTNTPWAVILPSMVTPFGVFLITVYAADAVDTNLLEAARIDGAGEFRIFLQVTSRLLQPGIVTVFLFTLVATWNNYFLPLIMLNSSQLYPLTVGLAQWQATSAGGSGSQAMFSTVITGAFLAVLPLVLAFHLLQKYWTSGLAAGSVKG
jgi:multiple sugar transport system permease protein